MTETQQLRIKSAMIIYGLETSLGNYIIEQDTIENITDKNKDAILTREIGNAKQENVNVSFLVESSYLDEVFNLAIDVTNGTSLNSHMKALKDLCTYLGVFEIRNAISHPNRPFPDSYWFRSAVIASDPLIELLGLGNVRQALNSAITEKLNSPPEEWFNNVKWAIPNTLPNSFDHEITGLLGRTNEFKDLYATLSKKRNSLIAVVAPGGIGKTALILEFLKELSLTPKWSEMVSSIIFCTLKNERLTAHGIQKIEAIVGMEQIKDSILSDLNSIYENESFESFEEACEKLENEKVLICIDNLETLLMNSQKEFIDFNQSLPLHWRVIVTSRISVDSATTVRLEPLVKRHGINLSRNYFRKRGVQNIEQSTLEKIAEMSNYNPLAIRLTVDLFIKGVDINQSISQSQKDIASFSYNNLIESLHENSIAILEAIFALSASTKAELTEFLSLSNEQISESLNELSKTSLITRVTNDLEIDSYELSDSIRDLLLVNPKNIEVRFRISNNLRDIKAKIKRQTAKNEESGINRFDDLFIEPDTNRSIHVLILDLNNYFFRKKENYTALGVLRSRFTDLLPYHKNEYQLIYHYSKVLRDLKDTSGQLNALQEAKSLNEECPRINFAIGNYHFHQSDYDMALVEFAKLFEKKYGSPTASSVGFSYQLNKKYLESLWRLKRYDDILEITENWENSDSFALYGLCRANVFRRQSQYQKEDIIKREDLISKCFDILNTMFKDDMQPSKTCHSVSGILFGFSFILNNSDYSDNIKEKMVSFIAKHFFNIKSRISFRFADTDKSKELLSNAYNANIKPNPLHDVNWYPENSISVYDKEHMAELMEDGYTIVEVYNIPEKDNGLSNFIFAKDHLDRQFFLVVDKYEGGWNGWGHIEIGSKLAIQYDNVSDDAGKSTPATEILNIDQYVE